MDWLDLLAVQGTLKNLLEHHSSKASIFRCSAFFTVQLSHPYMTGKTIALTRWTFVGKVVSLLFNMLSRLVITFLPRSKRGAETSLKGLLEGFHQAIILGDPFASTHSPKHKMLHHPTPWGSTLGILSFPFSYMSSTKSTRSRQYT